MFWQKSDSIRRFLRYAFFVSFILWIITSIFIVYKYVWFSSDTINKKWWTFVEWIFDSTSYLPYLRNDLQSHFYQWLLFDSCLSYSVSSSGIHFTDDLCSVSTKDDKTFVITFNKGKIRSDWTPVSLDDILFTYQDIIVSNKRSIKNLALYKDIIITKESDSSLKVVFPIKSIDNKIFFTQYILPSHILKNFDFQNYREIFSLQPVYTNCANIVSQNTDQYSLIFNLVNCTDTNLNFYQIKNHTSFDTFATALYEKKWSIVDTYISDQSFSWYTQYNLQTNKIITLFFNTNSERLRVRTRRALGWFIKRNFYSTWYEKYLIKNNDWLFDTFLSTGTNIKDFLTLWSTTDTVLKKDLTDSWVKPFSGNLSVNTENQKFVFYTESNISKAKINVQLNTSYNKIAIEYNKKEYPWSLVNKKAEFTIGSYNKTFSTWLNKYTIVWWVKNQKTTIATIDIYNIAPEESTTTSWTNNGTISIVYYDNKIYDPIINNLQTLFEQNNIKEYFSFEPISSLEEFEGKLLLNDYDIIINTIDMWLRRDITKLFSTDSSIKNPSQYQNTRLISLLQQYTKTPDNRVLKEINDIYSKDMPFVILWKEFIPLQIKSSIREKISLQQNIAWELSEYNRRDIFYNKIQLVNTVHIDWKKVWDQNNFSLFIKEALGLRHKDQTLTPTQEDAELIDILNSD